VIFDGIEWDENNLDHARRRVTAAEIEEVITNATSAIVESPLVSVWIRTDPLVACRAAPDHTTPNASVPEPPTAQLAGVGNRRGAC